MIAHKNYNMYLFLKNAHSGWRYIVLVLLIIAVVNALRGWLGKRPYAESSRKLNLFTLISAHIQLLLGLVLYFFSPLTKGVMSDPLFRYWKVEHISMMILAVILTTIGNSRSKKLVEDTVKHKSIVVFFGLGLVIIIAAIIMMTKVGPATGFFGMS